MCPLYVAGLIGPGDRKSVGPMAERVAPGDYDRLHHFVSDGVWDEAPLECELALQADKLVGGADALAMLLRGDGDRGAAIQTIQDEEHKADDIIRDVLTDLRRVFVTPFDRSAITALIGAMDDAIDEMNATAKSAELYEVSTFEPGMRDIAAIVVEAARVTQEAVPLLRNLGKNASRLTELTARLVELEGHADDIHAAGLKSLFKAHGASAPMDFIVGREIYSHLEKVVDRFEDVANRISGIVIEHD